MTVQEFQGGAVERAATLLAHFLNTTVEDKRDWTPTIEGAEGLRSAQEQVRECILVNRMIAKVLRGEAVQTSAPPSQSTEQPFSDIEEAQAKLIESGRILGDAIRALSDEDLTREFTTRRGQMAGYLLIEMPLRNMHYHSGQINLLQLCYGDTEFRPNFAPPKKD
jgi:hypothetical protein